MKIIPTNYIQHIKKVLPLITKHSIICFFIVFGGLAGFLVMKVGNLAQAEPTQFQVDDKLSTIKVAKVDTIALQVIRSLKSRESNTATSFDTTRTNPFEDQ